MVNVEQLKIAVRNLPVAEIAEALEALSRDGLVSDAKTPFGRVHFNTCFAEVEALFQRAGYHRPLDVLGYQGLAYALYDASRWPAVDVLRQLKAQVEQWESVAKQANLQPL